MADCENHSELLVKWQWDKTRRKLFSEKKNRSFLEVSSYKGCSLPNSVEKWKDVPIGLGQTHTSQFNMHAGLCQFQLLNTFIYFINICPDFNAAILHDITAIWAKLCFELIVKLCSCFFALNPANAVKSFHFSKGMKNKWAFKAWWNQYQWPIGSSIVKGGLQD